MSQKCVAEPKEKPGRSLEDGIAPGKRAGPKGEKLWREWLKTEHK
jgi:hypothetical protein